MKHNLVLTLAFCIVLTLPVLAQNVGIGLDTPSHKLTILSPDSNTVRLLGPGVLGSQARLSFGNAGGAFFEEDVDDHLTIYSKWRTGLLGGWVGVGTKSPEGPLHTFWKYGGFTTIVENTDTTGDFSGVFGLFRNNAGTGFSLGLNSTTHFDPEATFLDVPLHLKILTGGAERMRITQYGNVGIGTDTPDSSAMLHVQSTDKGMLIPRMTTAGRNAITTPATGLLVYDTDTGSFWYYEYNVWNEIAIPRLQIDSGTDTATISIPDSDLTGITDTITLSDPDTISADLQFKVCLDITHSWTSDLDISLESPDGTVIDLSSNNGGSGDNYTGTCFTTGSANPITGGSAPFIGDWQPEEPFSNFIGDNIAGGWKLKVVDEAGGDIGQLNNWAISISRAFGPTMLADGDGDTRVTVEDQPDEDMIRMLTGGASRMVITSNGDVGIGTSSPSQLLTLSDATEPVLRFERHQSTAWDYEILNTSGGKLKFRGGADATGGGLNEFVTFDGLGNVGIGTPMPANKLDVEGGLAIGSSYSGASTAPSNGAIIQGNVGIGTSSPSWNLDIVGSGVDNGTVFQMSNSDKSQFLRLFSGRQNDQKPSIHWQAGSPLLFQSSNDDNTQYNEWMRITADGSVGIGTSTPSFTLDVSGDFLVDGGLTKNVGIRTLLNDVDFNITNGGLFTNSKILRCESAVGATRFEVWSGGGIYAPGNVGIGKTPDSYALSIEHGATGIKLEHESAGTEFWEIFHNNPTANRLQLWNTNGTVGYFDYSSGAYIATSDRRLKENIVPLHSLLPSLMQLQVKKYTYKSDPNHKVYLGFIAQDVEALFPELVSAPSDAGDRESPYMMNYSGFGVIAVRAIQEQQEIIEGQQMEIDDLRTQLLEMDELKKRTAKLEAFISTVMQQQSEDE